MIKLIKKYLSIFSVSGSEENLAATIKSDISPFVDSVTIDAMGNLIAYKKGSDSSKKIMLAAHMDEIGFVVTFIEDNGFIRVAPVGGIRAIASSYSEVVFENGTKGVLVLEDGLVASDVSPKKLVVDIGAKNKKEAAKKVSVGEYLSLTQRITRLFGNRYAAKAFDDRVACAVLVQTAINSKLLKYDTYFTFTVQEEVGCRGSKAAANLIMPDFGIACDVTPCNDTVGASFGNVKLGGGAAIKIKDSSVICSKLVTDKLTEIAEKNNIKYQYEVLTAGGTDTSSMQIAGSGCHAGCISIPSRYIHSPVEVVDIADVEACVALMTAFICE